MDKHREGLGQGKDDDREIKKNWNGQGQARDKDIKREG